ncbi:MAG: transketolase [Butyrivibrio sp.]|nr:transketolase [Butyrivibrio sp.]
MLKTVQELREIARDVRIDALRGIHSAGAGHPGGSLSVTDILVSLYFNVMNVNPEDPKMEGRDRLVLSKGHAAPALYSVLAHRGYFDPAELLTLRKLGSRLQGHPSMELCPGVEMSTGSLGQGFSVAVGMAIADKIDGKSRRTFVVTGDGELQEGIIWEAALSAAKHGLDNLIAVVDWNNLQIDGVVDTVKKVAPIDDKFAAFGWETFVCDGHDMQSLLDAYEKAMAVKGKPVCIVAKTVKGKGVSFMENQAGWHGKAPSDEQLEAAIKELGGEK